MYEILNFLTGFIGFVLVLITGTIIYNMLQKKKRDRIKSKTIKKLIKIGLIITVCGIALLFLSDYAYIDRSQQTSLVGQIQTTENPEDLEKKIKSKEIHEKSLDEINKESEKQYNKFLNKE